jgi:hypothetical protein
VLLETSARPVSDARHGSPAWAPEACDDSTQSSGDVQDPFLEIDLVDTVSAGLAQQ